MAEPDNTPRPSSPVAAAEETTPLLTTECIPRDRADAATLAEIPLSYRNGGNRTRDIRDTRTIKIFSYVSLIISVVTGIFLLGITVVIVFDRHSSYSWYLSDSFPALGFFIFLTLILSLFVLRRISVSSRPSSPPTQVVQNTVIHPFFNALFDILLALYIANLAGTIYDGITRGYGSCPRYGDDVDICYRWRLAFQILSGGIIVGAAIVALSHLIIFVVRILAIFRSRFWTRPSQWNIAPGRYTLGFEFTIKFLRPSGEGESSV